MERGSCTSVIPNRSHTWGPVLLAERTGAQGEPAFGSDTLGGRLALSIGVFCWSNAAFLLSRTRPLRHWGPAPRTSGEECSTCIAVSKLHSADRSPPDASPPHNAFGPGQLACMVRPYQGVGETHAPRLFSLSGGKDWERTIRRALASLSQVLTVDKHGSPMPT